MKIVKALEEFDILQKGITKTIKHETKEQKGRFLSMLLGTLAIILLGNMLAGHSGHPLPPFLKEGFAIQAKISKSGV